MKYEYVQRTFTLDGKRYKVYGKTLEEALEKKAERKRELLESTKASGGNMPVREWYEIAYKTFKVNVSQEYLSESMYRVEKHIIPSIGNLPLKKVTTLDCQKIMNKQKGKSKSHISKLSQELFFIFDSAMRNKMIRENPMAYVTKPRGTERKRRALTEDERKHLLNVLPTDQRFIFFELMLYCGCRPAEAANARYEDVTQIDGMKFLHIRGTKTVNSDRVVPIPPALLERLSRTQDGYICTTLNGTHHTESSYKRMVSSLERAMNIDMGAKLYRNELLHPLPLAKDFVPYLLRHTYCTDLKKKGVDVRTAKELMGHSDIRTTANIYDHCDNESLMVAAQKISS